MGKDSGPGSKDSGCPPTSPGRRASSRSRSPSPRPRPHPRIRSPSPDRQETRHSRSRSRSPSPDRRETHHSRSRSPLYAGGRRISRSPVAAGGRNSLMVGRGLRRHDYSVSPPRGGPHGGERVRPTSPGRRVYATSPGRRVRPTSPVRRGYGRADSRSRSPVRRSYGRANSRSRSPIRSTVRYAGRSPPVHRYQNNVRPSHVLGIFGMSARTTKRDLEDLFSRYGRLDHVELIADRITGASRRFGFVYYTSIQDASRAKDEMRDTAIDGMRVRIDFSLTTTGGPGRHEQLRGISGTSPIRRGPRSPGRSPIRRGPRSSSRSRSPPVRRQRSRSRSPPMRKRHSSRSFSRSPVRGFKRKRDYSRSTSRSPENRPPEDRRARRHSRSKSRSPEDSRARRRGFSSGSSR